MKEYLFRFHCIRYESMLNSETSLFRTLSLGSPSRPPTVKCRQAFANQKQSSLTIHNVKTFLLATVGFELGE